MLEIEKTVVKLAVINDMLASVKKPIEDARSAVKTWLKSKSKPDHVIEDTFHVYLQVSEEDKREVTDDAAVELELQGLIRTGRYTQAELQQLVAAGVLGITDPSAAAGVVAMKLPGYTAPLKTVISPATDPDQAPLKILAKPNARFDGLRTLVRGVGDIRPVISRILEAPLPVPAPKPLPQGQVVLQRVKKK